jgi:hypothetical protein
LSSAIETSKMISIILLLTGLGDWAEWNGYGYAMLRTASSRREAERACAAVGAHLGSIHSLEEQQFLTELLQSSAAWIGFILNMI